MCVRQRQRNRERNRNRGKTDTRGEGSGGKDNDNNDIKAYISKQPSVRRAEYRYVIQPIEETTV